MKRKAQIDFPIVTFAVLLIGLILLAPIMLKIVRDVLTPVGTSLGNLSVPGGEEGGASVLYILGVFVNFWDAVLLFAFMLALIMLFVSALFIDTNPFFIILYILILFLTVIFAPNILDAVNRIYDSAQFVDEVALLGFMDFLRLNFGLVLTVAGILSMIIIYAKVRYFPRQ